MNPKFIDTGSSCGRTWLFIDSYAVAMQGDLCRDPDLREKFNSHVWTTEMFEYLSDICQDSYVYSNP